MTDSGPWHRYVGPGAGRDARFAVAAALVAGALLGLTTVALPWPERLLLALLAADVCGGLVAQFLAPRPEAMQQGPLDRLLWISGQWMQFALFAWLLRDGEPLRVVLVGAVLSLGGLLLPLLAPALQRRAGLAAVGVGLLLVDATVGLVREGGWYLPLLLAKVLVARVPAPLPEEPPPDAPGPGADG